jgi:hypothetical protein
MAGELKMAGCAGEQLLTTHTAVQIRRTEINNDTFVFSLAVAEVSGEAYNYYHHTHRPCIGIGPPASNLHVSSLLLLFHQEVVHRIQYHNQ